MFKAGQYSYAIAVAGFGVIQLVFGQLVKGFFPGITSNPSLVYVTSIVFIIAGTGILFYRWRKYAALLAVFSFLALLLYPHFPRLLNNIHDPNRWTVFFQLVACCAGALLLAGRTLASRMSWMVATGRYAFAVSLLVFGVQHFMYADFIQTLIPGWIPSPLFWSWLIRIAFIATAVSTSTGVLTRLSGLFTGLMFLLWIILFHIPKVAADTNSEAEWTNLFIALGISGICFMIATIFNSQFIKKKVSK